MKKTLAATAALLTVCSFAFAAPPPGSFNSQRIHVSPSQRIHAPVHNRVRMTPVHQTGPAAGRMSSMPHGYHYDGGPPARLRVAPPPARVYVRPSLPHYYYRPLPPPPPVRRHYYGYSSVWWDGPVACYSYPYGACYGRYYARPVIHIGVRI